MRRCCVSQSERVLLILLLLTYLVVGTSDLSRPRDAWNPVATNTFDINGNFEFTIPIQQNVARRVFTIKIP